MADAARRAGHRRAADGPAGHRLTIGDCPPPERADLFARVHGLTPRETELLGHLATGADTRTAARALGVSQNTVQDHLKSIFAKTSTHDRRTLLARAHST